MVVSLSRSQSTERHSHHRWRTILVPCLDPIVRIGVSKLLDKRPVQLAIGLSKNRPWKVDGAYI